MSQLADLPEAYKWCLMEAARLCGSSTGFSAPGFPTQSTSPHGDFALLHFEVWKYYRSTGKVHAEVLQNLMAQIAPVAACCPPRQPPSSLCGCLQSPPGVPEEENAQLLRPVASCDCRAP